MFMIGGHTNVMLKAIDDAGHARARENERQRDAKHRAKPKWRELEQANHDFRLIASVEYRQVYRDHAIPVDVERGVPDAALRYCSHALVIPRIHPSTLTLNYNELCPKVAVREPPPAGCMKPSSRAPQSTKRMIKG